MTKEELATERNEVREILEDFCDELSQSNLDKISRVFSIINGDEKRIEELEAQIEKMKCCYNCSKDCGSIDRRICFENKIKDWELKK